MSIATVASMIEVLGLRRGPQDLPADQGVLVFWTGASLLSGMLVAAPSTVFPRMPAPAGDELCRKSATRPLADAGST
ncbi:hypothetical protein [Thioalkalivibrio sp.]|uniref:hypothetical protein n=1 Tax=Thioalkalivibrio sp. TaxID=2093813 RepID=UPI0012D65A5E|nr:hypothetical protein [Thioalkalivibrio sp.]TVP77947.1 MAG: hypothetical protein EA346_12145 [Thioalkalivibrio sp.]